MKQFSKNQQSFGGTSVCLDGSIGVSLRNNFNNNFQLTDSNQPCDLDYDGGAPESATEVAAFTYFMRNPQNYFADNKGISMVLFIDVAP